MVWSCSSPSHNFGGGGAGGEGGQADGLGEAGESSVNSVAGSVAQPNGEAGAESGGAPVTDAGSGSEQQGLSIVSTTPADAATGSERDIDVRVTFSSAIDADSISAQSIRVSGPSGPVSGELSVNDATVTFRPSGPWALFADYVVDVAETITATDTSPLGTAYQFRFQSRDGIFRKPERLSSGKAINLQVTGNRAGHVAAAWNDGVTPASTWAVVFDPTSAAWGEAVPVESDTQNDYSFACLALNERGQAFTVAGNSLAVWNRFDGTSWGPASTAGLPQTRSCALADDGTALTTWSDYVQPRALAATLSPTSTWSATTTLRSGATHHQTARFGAGFMALFEVTAEHAVYSRVYDAAKGWLPPTQVTPVDSSPNYWSLATSERAALFTWWDAAGVAKASLFEGTSWSSEVLGPVSAGTHARIGDKGHIAAWFHQNNAYAARYDLNEGWGDPVKLGASDGELFGPAAEVDGAGNALAAWANASNIVWRRALHSTADWSDPQQIKDQDPGGTVLSHTDALGNVTLVWINPLGIWASRFE